MAQQQFPEPTVGALIFNAQGQMLLVKSHKFNGQYVIPGGHIELGETMEEALRREILEETSLSICDIEFLCVQEFVFDEIFWKKRHFIFLDFICKTKDELVVLNDEAQEYLWALLDDCPSLPIEPYTRKTINCYLKKTQI